MSDPVPTLLARGTGPDLNAIGAALVALGVGLAAGVAIALGLGARSAPRTRPDRDRVMGVIEGRLQTQAAEIRRLADAARTQDAADERLASELHGARQTLEALRIREEDRRAREAEHAEVVRRLSTVLAGGSSKGRAGENVLREHLESLPPGMLTSDFRVNGKVVEYGLLLPDSRRLPVDSKWSALRELEALESRDDPMEREAAYRDVERIVAA